MMKKWFVSLAALVSMTATAAGLDDLKAFLNTTQTATGAFEQKVFSRGQEEKTQAGSGDFAFLRPGCFRWQYRLPFEEEMVSDGKTLWLYDKELEQVTVKQLTAALPATPASLLFGNNDFSKDFHVKNWATDDGLNWIVATPKDEASTFAEVRIAFKSALPAKMELKDAFGQETRLTFKDVQKNVPMKAEDFHFVVPKGVEVLEDKTVF